MSDPRLEELIRTLRPCRAAVIGDMMLDRYVNGNADRISPEAPIPILDVTDEYQMLGGAANVAMKVAELGSSVGAVGLVGVDAPGGSGVPGTPGFRGHRTQLRGFRGHRTQLRHGARGTQVIRYGVPGTPDRSPGEPGQLYVRRR